MRITPTIRRLCFDPEFYENVKRLVQAENEFRMAKAALRPPPRHRYEDEAVEAVPFKRR
jgi:hypothetical protein